MPTKTFYRDVRAKEGGGENMSGYYIGSVYARDESTVIPSDATLTSIKFKFWLSQDGGISSGLPFYYLGDKEKTNSKSSSNKYYYVGSADNHSKGGNTKLKTMTRLSSTSQKNMQTAGHNTEVSFSASELTTNNKNFIKERFFNSIKVTDAQFRASNSNNLCNGIEIDITYTEPTITPTNPTIVYPAAANRITYNTKPWLRFTANANTSKLYWRIDSGSWQNFSASNGSSYDKQWTTALSAGSHTVYCYSQSSTSTNSSTQSRAFTVASPQAAVTAGSVMDDATIDGLQTNIQNQQAYYGKTQTTFTTCDAGTKALDDHIDQLETAIEALPHPTSLSSVDAGASITATTINNIRTALTNA